MKLAPMSWLFSLLWLSLIWYPIHREMIPDALLRRTLPKVGILVFAASFDSLQLPSLQLEGPLII